MNRYHQLSVECGSGLDWAADTIKVAALDATYTFSASHRFLSELTGVLGSTALTGKVVKSDGYWDADDIADLATPGTTEVAQLVLYKDTGNAATSGLLIHMDSNDDPDLPYPPDVADPEALKWSPLGVIRVA